MAGLQGRTPMHEACRRGYFLLASLLLQHGADVHRPDEFHRTPLSLALRGHASEQAGLQDELADFASEENERPAQLTSLCRRAIREFLGNTGLKLKVSALPLPMSVREYLLYCDMPLWSFYDASDSELERTN